MKDTICAIIGAVGGLIAAALGGWDAALQTLFIFMVIDYLSGLIVAGVFHKSTKTENGALETRAHFKGLCKKGAGLAIVIVAYRLDMISHSEYLRDAVIIALITNETISIIENAGLMGLPIPSVLTRAIEVLKKKSDDPPADH